MDGDLTEDSTQGRAPRWVPLALLGAVALSVVLGIYRIRAKQLWYDEAFTALAAGRGPAGALRVAHVLDANMPLYIFGVSIWRLFGDGEATLRLLSVVAAAAGVVAVYLLAARLFDRVTGVLAAYLVAIAPFSVRYSQELRGYTFLLFFGAASTYLFVVAIETRRTRWFVVYTLVTAAGFYAHLAVAFVVVAQVVSLVVLARSRIPGRKLAMSAVSGAVLLLPLLYFIAVAADNRGTPEPPNLRSVPRYLANAAGGVGLALVLGALALVPLWMLWVELREGDHSLRTWHLAVVASGIVTPVVGLLVNAIVQGRSWSDRYLIVVLPFLVIAAAVGLRRVPRPLPVVVMLVVIVVLSGLKIRHWYYGPSLQDYQGAVAFVAAEVGPDDGILFCSPYERVGFEYYALQLPADERPQPLSPDDPWSRFLNVTPVSRERAATWRLGPDRIWVLPYDDYLRSGLCQDEDLLAGRTRTVRRDFGTTTVERWDR